MEDLQDTALDNEVLIESDEPFGEAPEEVDPQLWKIWIDEEELRKDQFLWTLKRAEKGQNVGLDNGLQAINRYIYGTHKARYYLIGAESSAGKTTIGDFMYVFNAWKSARKLGKRLKIFYLSFEIGRTDKLYRWASYFIFLKYGVRLPSDYLQGRINGMPPKKEHVNMVLDAYKTITEMLKDVIIVQDVIHPTKIFEDLIVQFEQTGKVERMPVTEEEKKKGKKGFVKGYEEYDPNQMYILYIDHLALTGTEMHLETKGIMDKMSKYMIVLRNLFHCTGVFIQQFSTDMMSAYRGAFGKKTEQAITPQRIDFGDSKATFRDADVVFGAVKPQKDMDSFMNYNLSKFEGLGDCFVAWYLMKNRYGPSNRILPLFLDGVTGVAYDLPTQPLNHFVMQEWYEKANEIETLCQVFSPKTD